MHRYFFLAALLGIALAGCGRALDNQDGMLESADFIRAQDGTLYSIECLKTEGPKITAGVPGAGRTCAADKLNESQVRGMYQAKKKKKQTYLQTLTPETYYGGVNSGQFCNQYFGSGSGNSCYGWLGYGQNYYNSQAYQPTCSSCWGGSAQQNPFGGYGGYPQQSQCGSPCSTSMPWASQPFYQNWNNWGWWYQW